MPYSEPIQVPSVKAILGYVVHSVAMPYPMSDGSQSVAVSNTKAKSMAITQPVSMVDGRTQAVPHDDAWRGLGSALMLQFLSWSFSGGRGDHDDGHDEQHTLEEKGFKLATIVRHCVCINQAAGILVPVSGNLYIPRLFPPPRRLCLTYRDFLS